MKRFFKRFGTDIAGYTCLLLVPFVGWLPGPGGIPLIIAGLGLLSVHNPWAKRLLDYVKIHSQNFRSIVFPNNKSIQIAWDIAALLHFSGSILLASFNDVWYIRGMATGIGVVASTAFMFNRNRLQRLQNKFKTKR